MGSVAAGVFVNPRGEFRGARFPILVSDDHTLKMGLFADYAAGGGLDGLLLGSSRTMKLRPAEVRSNEAQRFFNFGVGSARPEDDLAIYRWIRRQGAHPSSVIIGLDVEALDTSPMNANLERNTALWALIAPSKAAEAPIVTGLVEQAQHYKSVLTDSYGKDVLHSMLLSVRHQSPKFGFEADGYIRYWNWEAQRANGTFDFESQLAACDAEYLARYAAITSLSNSREADLEETVREAQADGASVTIWLTPLYPSTIAGLTRTTLYAEYARAAIEFLASIKRRFGAQTFDYTNPASFGAQPQGWYDCAHMDETNAALVAASLRR